MKNTYDQTRLQKTITEWILEGNPNTFITLRFRDVSVSYKMAEKAYGSFAHGLKCHFFGENSKKKLVMIPIVEGYHRGKSYQSLYRCTDTTHIHCLIKLPDPFKCKEEIRRIWVASGKYNGDPNVYCPLGSDDPDGWYKVFNDGDSQKVFARYTFKTCRTETEAILLQFCSFT